MPFDRPTLRIRKRHHESTRTCRLARHLYVRDARDHGNARSYRRSRRPERPAQSCRDWGRPRSLNFSEASDLALLADTQSRIDACLALSGLEEFKLQAHLKVILKELPRLTGIATRRPSLGAWSARECARILALQGNHQEALAQLRASLEMAERFDLWPEHEKTLAVLEEFRGAPEARPMVFLNHSQLTRVDQIIEKVPSLICAATMADLIDQSLQFLQSLLRCSKVQWFEAGRAIQQLPAGGVDLSGSLVERCFREERILVSGMTGVDITQTMAAQEVQSAIAIPIEWGRSSAVVVGVHRLINRLFGEEEEALARLFSQIVSFAAGRLGAEQETVRALEAESDLRRSFEAMFQYCPVAAAWISPDREILEANSAFIDLWGGKDSLVDSIWAEDVPSFQEWRCDRPLRLRVRHSEEGIHWLVLHSHGIPGLAASLLLVEDESPQQRRAFLQHLESRRRWFAIDLHDHAAQECVALYLLAQAEHLEKKSATSRDYQQSCQDWTQEFSRLLGDWKLARLSPMTATEIHAEGGPLTDFEATIVARILQDLQTENDSPTRVSPRRPQGTRVTRLVLSQNVIRGELNCPRPPLAVPEIARLRLALLDGIIEVDDSGVRFSFSRVDDEVY